MWQESLRCSALALVKWLFVDVQVWLRHVWHLLLGGGTHSSLERRGWFGALLDRMKKVGAGFRRCILIEQGGGKGQEFGVFHVSRLLFPGTCSARREEQHHKRAIWSPPSLFPPSLSFLSPPSSVVPCNKLREVRGAPPPRPTILPRKEVSREEGMEREKEGRKDRSRGGRKEGRKEGRNKG